MKQTKQRVIAIDYFRGVCLFLVLINHAVLFSTPFAIWTGAGGLWTSAAEMFLLLSGITFGIIRSRQISNEFQIILRKTWRRAAIIYLADIAVVFVTIVLALLLSAHNLTTNVNGVVPNLSPIDMMLQVFTFRVSIGWADFLMYYSVFLVFAPFLLYILKTKYWSFIPLLSLVIFTAHFFGMATNNIFGQFLIWQLYFALGLVIGRFRNQLLLRVDTIPRNLRIMFSYLVISISALILTFSFLIEHSIYNSVSRLVNEGWLPTKLQAGYLHLLNMRPSLDKYLLDGRGGLARPLVSLLIALAAYIVYRRYSKLIIEKSGKTFLAFGRNSLLVFIGQAIAIPLIAALPISHGNLLNNFFLTSLLIFSMWLLAERDRLVFQLFRYLNELQASFYQAKNAVLLSRQNDL